ncbi:MAG: ECF-type sigma factor [Acidobacteriota bacterium]
MTAPDDNTDRLFQETYGQLRRLAQYRLQGERREHTLQATDLVHEAYMALVDQGITWRDRHHFLRTAARAMRRVLVDWARHRGYQKRGGERQRVTLAEGHALDFPGLPEVLDLDLALRRLEGFDGRKARLVELRLFAGMTIEEAAPALGISTATVSREWRAARAWLAKLLQSAPDSALGEA